MDHEVIAELVDNPAAGAAKVDAAGALAAFDEIFTAEVTGSGVGHGSVSDIGHRYEADPTLPGSACLICGRFAGEIGFVEALGRLMHRLCREEWNLSDNLSDALNFSSDFTAQLRVRQIKQPQSPSHLTSF